MEIKNKFIFLMFIFIVITLISCVSAQLLMPHQFFGTATYNGAASEGIKVEAYFEGSVVKTTFTISGGYYMFKIEDPDENKEEKTIEFYLNGVNTGTTFVFENGASTELDLVASGPAPSPPSGGGGGGGGGSGGGAPTKKTEINETTQETTVEETETEEEAEEETTQQEQEITEQEEGFFSIITGAVVGTVGRTGAIVVVVVVVALIIMSIVLGILKKRKKK